MEQVFLLEKVVACIRVKVALMVGALMVLAGATRAQTLADLGTTAPTPGAVDIYQLSTSGQTDKPDGLNYYDDNQSNHSAGEPGQTFTTLNNSSGYVLNSLAIKTGGGTTSGTGTPQSYLLHIYSVSSGNAALIATYSAGNVTFADGDWLQWSGLSLPLSPDTVYAYSFGKASSAVTGWEELANAGGNPYSSGEIGLFPIAGGGITYGSSHAYDGVFDVGLVPANVPSINQLTVSPTNEVFSGTPVTFTASVMGAQPLYMQWRFNNGGGYVNLPGANTNTLAFNAAVTNAGSYEFVLTNSYGAVTSAPVVLSVTLDTNPPVVLRGFNFGTTSVEVDFSKTLDAAGATNPANYVFTDGLAITAASLAANGTSVMLTTGPMVYGSNYTLGINSVRDQAIPPNTIAANTQVSFTASSRNRILLDDGWRFQLGDPVDVTTNVTYYPEISDLAKLDAGEVGSATNTSSESYMETIRIDPIATHAGENVSFVQTNYDDSAWRQLNLPHDWVVELPFNAGADGGHGFKPVGYSGFGANNFGWYRHTFTLPAGDAGQALWLEFGGVYRNCLVWLNGHILGRNVSGYSSFYFDVTPYVNPGGTNVLVVRVDASRFEGWFYEGAGIYRHVWLTTENPVHVAEWGTFVATTSLVGSNATITVQTDVTNESGTATANGSLTSTILDANRNPVATVTSPVSVPAGQDLVVTQTVAVANANLWSLQTPYLYNLQTTVSNQNAVADIYNTPFGVRTVSIDSTNGVFINGKHVWIQGMCNHQDMAGVGSALPDRLQYYRIERLKEMGCNAYRSSHNEPTEELLDACDQLGMLVLDENRRIGTNAEPLSELSRQIRRDRNHPSVFMWSLANEESLQGTPTGASIMQVMQNLVHSMDSTRLCTAALNSWGSGFSSVLDVNGFNYALGAQDSFHASNPGWPIIGTETSSQVTDRGVYTNDTVNGYVWGYDLNPVSWGETAEAWWQYYYARPWSSGGFCWTGFDYRGEPTPYGWPCINSHFGILDTCGFPKDLFYYYQANWTLKPLLHLFPHWNWSTPGQPINIWAFGNCQTVELFVNGVGQGRQSLNVQGHVEWDNVSFAPGTLQAIGYNNGVAVLTNTITTTGPAAQIALLPDRNTILADGLDVSVVTVEVLDAQGNVVPTSTNEINFSISGGAIIGVGNGNPSSHEADKASNQRAVFNGLAEVIVQSISQPGPIVLTATSSGLTSTNVTITEAATLPPPAAATGMAAAGGNTQVTVTWDIVPGAATYNLWRATTSGGPYTLIAGNIGGVNCGYIDSNVTNLTTYYYVVTANGANDNGTSTKSVEVSATPSAIVTSLTATAGSGQILLSWNGSPGASYNVKRSTVTGGPYNIIASSIATTNYTDFSVVTCQSYFYVVTITNAGNESLPSIEASAQLPGGAAPPSPWLNTDIGAVGLTGSATYCSGSGQFTVSGSGADIWNTADAFQFVYVYVPVSTNCDIRARVLSVQNTDPWAKAGVMIRETLTAGSRNVYMPISYGNGASYQWRMNTSGSSSNAAQSGIVTPYWVRLTRTNNTFSGYISANGTSWSQVGTSMNITMASSAYAGLAVTAHNSGLLNSSVFDSVNASFLAPNTALTLTPISNQTVNVGQTVAFTAIATDTNSPQPSLNFSLLYGPASATLAQANNTNANFNWRPAVTNANSTNAVAMMVAVSGSPNLSATQSFNITVNPLTLPSVSSVSINNGQLGFQISGQTGPDYAVQVSSNLFNWSTLFITN